MMIDSNTAVINCYCVTNVISFQSTHIHESIHLRDSNISFFYNMDFANVPVTSLIFHKRYLSHQSLKLSWKLLIKNFFKISQGPMS